MTRDEMIAALREIHSLADRVWVDNVTGAGDVSDLTPEAAAQIMNLAKAVERTLLTHTALGEEHTP